MGDLPFPPKAGVEVESPLAVHMLFRGSTNVQEHAVSRRTVLPTATTTLPITQPDRVSPS
jgi:hypothetical protein